MRADIPFIAQEGEFDCGPTMLRIAIAWADKDVSYDTVKDVLAWQPGTAMETAQLCVAAEKLGFDPTLYSAQPSFNQDRHQEEEYYREHGDVDGVKAALKIVSRRDDLAESRVLTTGDIKERLGSELVIALLNWEETRGGEGYTGHFVVVTGVEDNTVFAHQVGGSPKRDMALDRSVFEAARRDERTDQDVLCLKP